MGSEYVLLPNGAFASVDEIEHSGIKGMKWGVRRYQNKDGSLTAAGRKRYNAEAEKLKEREKTIKNQERVRARVDKLNAKKAELDERQKALDEANGVNKSKLGFKKKDGDGEEAKKSTKDMSDEELYRALNRARMESEYNRLTNPQPMNNQQQGNGQQQGKSSGMMADMVKPAVVNAGRNFLQNALTKLGNKALEDKPDPNSIDALRKLAEKAELQKRIEIAQKGSDVDDKYLSWEDRTKKAAFQKNKATEDLAAKQENAKRENRKAAAKKAQEDYEKQVAAEKKRQDDIERAAKANAEKAADESRNKIFGQSMSNMINSKNTSTGKSYVDSSGDRPISSLDSSVDSGKSYFDWRGYDWDDD